MNPFTIFYYLTATLQMAIILHKIKFNIDNYRKLTEGITNWEWFGVIIFVCVTTIDILYDRFW